MPRAHNLCQISPAPATRSAARARRRGPCRQSDGHRVLPLAGRLGRLGRLGGTRCAQELDVADDVVVVTLGAVAVPLAVAEASVDCDEPALREVLGGGLAA